MPWSSLEWEVRTAENETAGGWTSTWWQALEANLWNNLLSRQEASGRFLPEGDCSDEDARSRLEDLISQSVIYFDSRLSVGLPVACRVEGEKALWRIRTSYPQHGSLTISYDGECEVPTLLRIRVPSGATNLQLVRSGVPAHPEPDADASFFTLPGPWQPGDSVDMRFGLPFTVARPGEEPSNRRYFPGAVSVPNAVIRHGVRDLIPWPNEPDEPVGEVTAGVRKDGVLMLQAVDADGPFASHGDAFLTADQPPRRLVARSLAASLGLDSMHLHPYTVEMGVFATNFDRGA